MAPTTMIFMAVYWQYVKVPRLAYATVNGKDHLIEFEQIAVNPCLRLGNLERSENQAKKKSRSDRLLLYAAQCFRRFI